jgi:hypothetical protein
VTGRRRRPYLKRMRTAVVALAVASLALTACGGQERRPAAEQPSGELRIAEVHVPGAPFPIEGEFSYVRAEGGDGAPAERRLDPDGTLRLRLAAGRYALSVWHRTCDGNCELLDPPSDRCEQTLDLAADEVVQLTIENTPGSPCRIVPG